MCCHSDIGVAQVQDVDGPGTTASFRRFHVDQIAADLKESICRVSDGPFDAQENSSIPTVSYEVLAFLPPAHNAAHPLSWQCIRQSMFKQH